MQPPAFGICLRYQLDKLRKRWNAMDNPKAYVKLWMSYERYFSAYSNEEVGRITRAMLQYRSAGELPTFSGRSAMFGLLSSVILTSLWRLKSGFRSSAV